MIIFEGRAPSPVYLYVENENAQVVPADDLWGKSVWETDELLHRKYNDPQLRIACVGRSAEAGCLYSAIHQRSPPGRGPLGSRDGDGVEEPQGGGGPGAPAGSPASRTRCVS